MRDLRVVVEEIRGFCDLPVHVGDYFEVRGGRIIVPPGKYICMWALQSIMPLLPVKQRQIQEENDWVPYTHRVCCPDPNGQVIYRIDPLPTGNDGSGKNGAGQEAGSDYDTQTGSDKEKQIVTARGDGLRAGTDTIPPRLLVDESRCSGCRACELTCSFVHAGVFGELYSRIRVEKEEEEGRDQPVVCRQCGVARCVEACPTEALSRDSKTRAIRVDEEKCVGCQLCARACSFSAIYFHPETGKALICDLCGGDPQCVKRCATSALRFGRAGERRYGE